MARSALGKVLAKGSGLSYKIVKVMRRSSKTRRIRSARGTVLLGDEVFETLQVERYQIFLGRLEFRTGSPEAAQDLVQDLYLRLWQKRHDLRSKTALAFAWALLRDMEIDWHRRQKVRVGNNIILLDDGDEEGNLCNELVCDQTPFTALERRDEIQRVNEHTKHLSENERQAIEITVFEGQRIEEAASLMKASKENVRKWKSRGLAKLRVEMSKTAGVTGLGGGVNASRWLRAA